MRALTDTRLDKCQSMEEYVYQIISYSNRLNAIKFKVDDEWIGTFLLAGLTPEYDPLIMGITSSDKPLSGDEIKTKLLLEYSMKNDNVKKTRDDNVAMASKFQNRNARAQKTKNCFNSINLVISAEIAGYRRRTQQFEPSKKGNSKKKPS
jgi:hypothetical protein